MSQVVPSLSLSGFVSDVPTMIDLMFSYYLTSDYSQSNVFNGRIISLQKQMQQYQHDEITLIQKVREELEGYFQSVVDSATVEVTTAIPNPEDPNRLNLRLSALLVKDGKSYSVGRLVRTQDAKILEIVKILNEG